MVYNQLSAKKQKEIIQNNISVKKKKKKKGVECKAAGYNTVLRH
jgi:hypothetical protein